MNQEDFERTLEYIFRKREYPPAPNCRIDFEALAKSGIPWCFEGGDMILFSATGIKKARELGIVTSL